MPRLLILVGALSIGCTTSTQMVTKTSAERLAWLQAEIARADKIEELIGGAYLPHGTPGAAIVCSLAIQIEAWYGVGDERWELSHATTMLPARSSRNLREELERIGIRDCVLDVSR